MKNLEVVGSSGANVFDIEIGPREEQMLWLKVIDPYAGYSLSRQMTYSLK